MIAAVKVLAAAYNVTANEIGVPNSTGDIGVAFTKITQLVMSLVGGLAVIFLIVGGLQIALSAGDPKKYAQGRNTVLYAVVGIAVSISALALVNLVSKGIKGGH